MTQRTYLPSQFAAAAAAQISRLNRLQLMSMTELRERQNVNDVVLDLSWSHQNSLIQKLHVA